MNNSINSPSFTGVKYYNYNGGVVNSWFNYRMRCDSSSINKVRNIIEKQKNNPHHIILDYHSTESNKVIEKATVNGKEFVKRQYESFRHMLKRAADYADSLRKTPAKSLENENRLSDFVLDN